eukprot:666133-Pleurochrysis_carterae.AAC.3
MCPPGIRAASSFQAAHASAVEGVHAHTKLAKQLNEQRRVEQRKSKPGGTVQEQSTNTNQMDGGGALARGSTAKSCKKDAKESARASTCVCA